MSRRGERAAAVTLGATAAVGPVLVMIVDVGVKWEWAVAVLPPQVMEGWGLVAAMGASLAGGWWMEAAVGPLPWRLSQGVR